MDNDEEEAGHDARRGGRHGVHHERHDTQGQGFAELWRFVDEYEAQLINAPHWRVIVPALVGGLLVILVAYFGLWQRPAKDPTNLGQFEPVLPLPSAFRFALLPQKVEKHLQAVDNIEGILASQDIGYEIPYTRLLVSHLRESLSDALNLQQQASPWADCLRSSTLSLRSRIHGLLVMRSPPMSGQDYTLHLATEKDLLLTIDMLQEALSTASRMQKCLACNGSVDGPNSVSHKLKQLLANLLRFGQWASASSEQARSDARPGWLAWGHAERRMLAERRIDTLSTMHKEFEQLQQNFHRNIKFNIEAYCQDLQRFADWAADTIDQVSTFGMVVVALCAEDSTHEGIYLAPRNGRHGHYCQQHDRVSKSFLEYAEETLGRSSQVTCPISEYYG